VKDEYGAIGVKTTSYIVNRWGIWKKKKRVLSKGKGKEGVMGGGYHNKRKGAHCH